VNKTEHQQHGPDHIQPAVIGGIELEVGATASILVLPYVKTK
jgi:hypothetical protein